MSELFPLKLMILIFTLSLFGCSSTSPKSSITWTDCGGKIGDHACDFTLLDHTGGKWQLYKNHGKIIVLDFSAMWCGYCQAAAQHAQAAQDEHREDNVVWVTILLQNNYGQTPSLQDLKNWAEVHGIVDAPVVAGTPLLIDPTAKSGYDVDTWPGFVIIDRDLRIVHELRGWNEFVIKSWLTQLTSEPAIK